MSSFAKKTFLTAAAQIAVFVLTLISSVVIARSLGPQGRGEYALALIPPTFILFALNSGMGNAAVYLVGSGTVPVSVAIRSNLALWGIHSLAGLACGAISIVFGADKFFRGVPVSYLWLGLLTVPALFYLSFILPVFLGKEDLRTYNVFQVVKPALFIAGLMALFVISDISPAYLLLLENLVLLLLCLLIHKSVLASFGPLKIGVDREYLRKALKYGASLYLGYLLMYANSSVLLVMMNLMLTAAAVGIYTIALTVSDKMMLFADAVSTVLYPNVSSISDKLARITKTLLVFRITVVLIGAGAALLAAVSSPLVLFLFSAEFSESVPCLQILLLGSVFASGYRVLASAIKGMGAPLLQSNIYVLGFILNVLLAVILSEKSGMTGFAWASVISQAAMCGTAMLCLARSHDLRWPDFFVMPKEEFRKLWALARGWVSWPVVHS